MLCSSSGLLVEKPCKHRSRQAATGGHENVCMCTHGTCTLLSKRRQAQGAPAAVATRTLGSCHALPLYSISRGSKCVAQAAGMCIPLQPVCTSDNLQYEGRFRLTCGTQTHHCKAVKQALTASVALREEGSQAGKPRAAGQQWGIPSADKVP